jgi:hypothetical protein
VISNEYLPANLGEVAQNIDFQSFLMETASSPNTQPQLMIRHVCHTPEDIEFLEKQLIMEAEARITVDKESGSNVLHNLQSYFGFFPFPS